MRKIAMAPDGLPDACMTPVLESYRLAVWCEGSDAARISQRHEQRVSSFELVLMTATQDFLPYALPSDDQHDGKFHMRLEYAVANLGIPHLLALARADRIRAAMMSVVKMPRLPPEIWLVEQDDFASAMLAGLRYEPCEPALDQFLVFRL